MADFLLAAAAFVLAVVVVGLVQVLRGPGRADRIMAVQLLGTGGVAVLLLLAQAVAMAGVVDVSLVLGLLAAFAAIAFVKAVLRPAADQSASGGGK